MPNWCSCQLTIKGPDDQLTDLFYRAIGQNLSLKQDDQWNETEMLQFENFIPIEEFNRFNNSILWGCDGRIDFYDVQRWEGQLFYAFLTAWGPPDQFVKHLIESYPQVHFYMHYCEPGMAFAGEVWGENGEWNEESHEATNEDLERHGMLPDDEDDED